MIKKGILIWIVLSVGRHAFSQQIPVASDAPGAWQQLGEITINFATEHDAFVITSTGTYRALKFKVHETAVRIISLTIVYDNNEEEKLSVRYLIQPYKVWTLNLKGKPKKLKRVAFTYIGDKRLYSGKTKIALWGMV